MESSEISRQSVSRLPVVMGVLPFSVVVIVVVVITVVVATGVLVTAYNLR